MNVCDYFVLQYIKKAAFCFRANFGRSFPKLAAMGGGLHPPLLLLVLVVVLAVLSHLPTTAAFSSSPPPPPRYASIWRELGAVDVCMPSGVRCPLGVVHFVGGQGVGSAPRSAYGPFLEGVAGEGFVVVATKFGVGDFNHQQQACDVAREFRLGYRELEKLYGRQQLQLLPVFGIGHSMGAKLHVLINSYVEVEEVALPRKANVLISFNNFAVKDSIPLFEELRGLAGRVAGLQGERLRASVMQLGGPLSDVALKGFDVAGQVLPGILQTIQDRVPMQFLPSPEQTWALVEEEYATENNLIIQFKDDSLDQSSLLAEKLFRRFGRDGDLQLSRLQGSHITPNTPEISDELAERGAEKSRRELAALVRTTSLYLKAQALWAPKRTTGNLMTD
jgi:hypothetical protein